MYQREFKYRNKQVSSLEIIIGLNVLLFLFSKIFIAFRLFSLRQVALPLQLDAFLSKIWTLFTYGFFHQDFIALFFNMLLLFYFGNILIDFRSEKRLLYLYFFGVIFGGLFFLGSYYLFPDMYVLKTPLLGASAGVMSVMTYTALFMPSYQIKIRFLGYFKLIHILIFFVVLNLLQIPLGNPGGYFAHFGGLTIGVIWFFLLKRKEEHRIVSFDIFSNSLKKSSMPSKQRIDKILDKINRSGYDSLTKAEKEELFRQSKK